MSTAQNLSTLPALSLKDISTLQLSNAEPAIKKKKKKRQREEGEPEATASTDRKKKRKHAPSDPEIGVNHVSATTEGPSSSRDREKKKKRSKKDKVTSIADDVHSDTSPHATTTALLSAIVAAATTTPEMQPMVGGMHLDPHSQFSVANHYTQDLSMFDPSAYSSTSMFPSPVGLPFSDIAFGSNDDVLRALQDLDISKITNVLRTLGEAAAAANVPSYGQANFSSAEGSTSATPLNQIPAQSNSILKASGKNPQALPAPQRRTISAEHLNTQDPANPDHAYLLANKWMNASKLAEMVTSQGLQYKKGKFSAIEEQQLETALEVYRKHKQLTAEQLQDIIFPKNERNKDNAFWTEITSAIPHRPLIAVYHHVRRSHHPMKQQGKWTPEQDAKLKQAVADLGQQWEKVSARVMRMSSDCRDRYRNHIVNRDIRVTGQWSKEEEDQLTRIVTSMTIDQGKDIDNDVFWGRVSELMGGTRGRQQCRIKWTDALSKTVKNDGQKPRWSQQDAFILVHKIDSLNVRDDTEIDWKTIGDVHWNLWSAHALQRRWLTMKRSVKGYEDMTHQEIMDILRLKKAQLPASPPAGTRKRKERKVTSAADIADPDTPAGTLTPNEGSSSTRGGAEESLSESDNEVESILNL